MEKNNITFEKALDGLKENAEKINLVDSSLEDAINAYNAGLEYYEICNRILDENEQKIVKVER